MTPPRSRMGPVAQGTSDKQLGVTSCMCHYLSDDKRQKTADENQNPKQHQQQLTVRNDDCDCQKSWAISITYWRDCVYLQ